ncbi:hypothetical protein AHAS_Ahas05G0057400 [Arachis hypogaea]
MEPLQWELIGHVEVKLWSVNRVMEGMITQNVHTGSNLRSYYMKPMLYNILVYIGRVHLIKYDSGLHLKGRMKRGFTEKYLIITIQSNSKECINTGRQSQIISLYQALILQLKYAEHDLYKYLQALIL